jgi:hypothetical protein
MYDIGNIKTIHKLRKLLHQVASFTEDHDAASCFSTEYVAHLLAAIARPMPAFAPQGGSCAAKTV